MASRKASHFSSRSRAYFTIRSKQKLADWTPEAEAAFLKAASRIVAHDSQWWVDCSRADCKRLTPLTDWKSAITHSESSLPCAVCAAQDALNSALEASVDLDGDAAAAYQAGRQHWDAQQEIVQQSRDAGHDFSYMMLPPTRETMFLMSLGAYSRKLESWAKAVKDRDKWCCTVCGEKERSLICAHHIVSRTQDTYLALDLNNGRTLCTACHEAKHAT